MPSLKLKWWQLEALREQIEVAKEGRKLGRMGEITTTGEHLVAWDSMEVQLEIPEEEQDVPTMHKV